MSLHSTGQPLPPGSLLAGRYRLQRLLRADALATRYLAEDAQGGAGVTVCELPALQFAAAEDRTTAASWFSHEASRLRAFAHPALAAVRDHWATEDPGAPFYLVLDHIPGLSLADEIEEAGGRISWRLALDWCSTLCEALAYLHGEGHVHGHLRPQHIVLDSRTDLPVLVDYGLAWRLSGTAGDSWGYVPFEQYIGRNDPRSDLYALGVLLHTLLTGADPDMIYTHRRRGGQDVQHCLRALLPPLESVIPGLPGALAAIVTRATAFSAEDRFPDAAAMAVALRRVRGPQVEVATATHEATEPVWTRAGLTRDAWFALPAAERNRRLLSLAQPPPLQP